MVDCVEAVQAKAEPPGKVVMLTPAGERLTQRTVEELAEEPRLLLLCGRYEGFDDRIRQVLEPAGRSPSATSSATAAKSRRWW